MERANVRAKFRVMGVEQRWDGTRNIELLPVTDKGSNAENAQFWKYTPAGKIDLTIAIHKPCEFKPGCYYYVDFTLSNEGRWVLVSVTQHAGESGEVRLNAGWNNEDDVQTGVITMTIDNAAALDVFLNRAGSPWNVAFTFAEESDFE